MIKKLIIAGLLLGLTGACSSSTEDTTQIDYSKLQKIPGELVMEIGETEDFLPGRLRDIVVISDGNMLVSDWASGSITQFDSDGNLVATIAKEGGGPGELGQYFRVKNISDDTVMVLQLMANTQHYFAMDSNKEFQFVRSNALEKSSREIKILNTKTDSSFYARRRNSLENVKQINDVDYQNTVLITTTLSGEILQDSVLILKKGNRHHTQQGRGGILRTIPYRYNDHFVALENGRFLIARPDSNLFSIYNKKHQLQRRIPLSIKPRPITEEDLDYHLEDIESNKVRSEIEARIDEQKPPYLDVWATKKHLWLKTSNDKKGKEMVILDFEGNAVGKFMLPTVDQIQVIRGKHIYTIHHSPTKGNTIRKYEMEI